MADGGDNEDFKVGLHRHVSSRLKRGTRVFLGQCVLFALLALLAETLSCRLTFGAL